MRTKLILFALTILFTNVNAQLPDRVLVGYWHNWESLRIKDVDDSYNVIVLSFLEADKNNNQDDNVVGDLEFTPWSKSQLLADIPVVQGEGKKVIISIGGANGSFKLNNVTDKNTFVTKVKDFIETYKVDGIDIDLERSIYMCTSGGTMSNPQAHVQYLIDGVKEIDTWFKNTYNKEMILTTAPEVAYTTGGLSQWGACKGAFLPFIEQLSDEIDLLMIQLYNSGSNFSIQSNTEYFQGTMDFIITQTEAAIEGFTNKNAAVSGKYSGLAQSKVVVALPACNAAGGGWINTADVKKAVEYLLGTGPQPGSYTLKNGTGYPDLRGMMTWSINNDVKSNCDSQYAFARNYDDIFGDLPPNSVNEIDASKLNIYPNPADDFFTVEVNEELLNTPLVIYDLQGKVVYSAIISNNVTNINTSDFTSGFYTVIIGNTTAKLIVN